MKFHALKSLCTVLISALLFSACADETKKTGEANITPPTGTSCSVVGTALVCDSGLGANDLQDVINNANALTKLDFSYNVEDRKYSDSGLTQAQLNSLPEFPILTELSLANNNMISSLDLAKFPALEKLDISNTRIATLEAPTTKSINDTPASASIKSSSKAADYNVKYLDVSGTRLPSLDLTKYTQLETLIATNVPKIKGFESFQRTLKSLTISAKSEVTLNTITKLTKLTNLTINGYEGPVDLSSLTNLEYFKVADYSNSTYISSLNLTGLTKLKTLIATYVQNITGFESFKDTVTTLSLWNINGASGIALDKVLTLTKLTDLTLYGYTENTIDLSNLTNLTSLSLSMYSPTTIDLSKLTQLTSLSLSMSKVTKVDLTSLTNLTTLDISGAKIVNINFAGLAKLTRLGLSGMPITSLDLAPLVNLKGIFLDDLSNLVSVDISKLVNLESIFLQRMDTLTTLDISTQAKLVSLNINTDTPITGFDKVKNNLQTMMISGSSNIILGDIINLPNLVSLHISSYDTASLDLAGLPKLVWLDIAHFQSLATFDLTKLPNLIDLGLEDLPALTTVNLTKQTKLLGFSINEVGITKDTLNVSTLTKASRISVSNMGDKLTKLDVSALTGNLTSLSLYTNSELNELLLGEASFSNLLEVTGFDNTMITSNNIYTTFPEDGSVTIELTNPNFYYPSRP